MLLQHSSTFFSSSRRIYTKTDHIIGYKTRLNICRRIQVIQSMFSDQMGLNYKPIVRDNLPNIWKVTNTLLNNP